MRAAQDFHSTPQPRDAFPTHDPTYVRVLPDQCILARENVGAQAGCFIEALGYRTLLSVKLALNARVRKISHRVQPF